MHLKRDTLTAVVVSAMALGAAPALAAADQKKPADGPATAALAADQAPDRSARGATASAAATQALATIQRRTSDYVAANGTQYTFASHLDSGRIVLETNAPAKVVSQLTSMSSPDLRREVSNAQVRRTTISDTWSRSDDIEPFWGGAAIKFGDARCTSGYAVRNSAGRVFSVTAGHCFPNGANVLVESGLRSYGIVSARRLPPAYPMDMELVGGKTYAGRVYSGTTSSRGVAAAGAAVVGFSNYCHSGRTTGEQCGHTATSINAQVCTATGCKAPMIRFTGGVMPAAGDTGSPFYAIDSAGKVWIRGHVIAVGGGVGYAQPWTTVASTYGVSIVTG